MKLHAWLRVTLAFAVYATALLLAPAGWWRAAPWLWSAARAAPYWMGVALCALAWATKDEGPEPQPRGLPPADRLEPSAASDGNEPDTGSVSHRPTPSCALAQIVLILSLSNLLDLAVGALARSGLPWELAWATSGLTWGMVAAALLWDLRAIRRSTCPTRSATRAS